MKKGLVLAMGLFFVSAGLMFAGDAKDPAVAFTLATTTGDPTPISFTLLPRPAEPTVLEGVGGFGYLEDNVLMNTAIGWEALVLNVSGERNTASGFRALYSNLAGSDNTANGWQALYSNTTGFNNTASGSEALFSNTTGNYNTASGQLTLNKSNGSHNTANGFMALYSNTTGCQNTANGAYALQNNTTSNDNTAIGSWSLLSSVDGHSNTAIGTRSLVIINHGINNTALGESAGAACEQGNYNLFLGAFVTGLREDTNTIRIGSPYDPTQNPPAGQNQTFIAGIVENPMASSASVVGITSEGRLGTMSSDLLPQGPQGPQGVPGKDGEGLIRGSLLFLVPGSTVPTGYILRGNTDIAITQPNKKSTKITVNVYQKQ